MTIWRNSKRFLRRVPQVFQRSLSDTSDTFPFYDPSRIRNFSIIAHVDHGKSTLADRLIEIGGVKNSLTQQLDSLQVERERGITVKAQCASLRYTYNGVGYLLNLIDTPGHADFNHEVGRSLFLSDGAVLLVDAVQGVQAQTVNNFYCAFERELSVIGAINKIDLPRADVETRKKEMRHMFDLDETLITCLSAKTNENVGNILPQIIEHIPSPSGKPESEFVAVLHDCQHLSTQGIVVLTILVKDGTVTSRDTVCMLRSGKTYPIREIGVFLPSLQPTHSLSAGQVGYLIMRVKDVADVIIGDTICMPSSSIKPLETLPKPKPSIFCGVFPDEETEFGSMKESLVKLVQSDSSVFMETHSNETLGEGWKLGFLGGLHREVFGQRLLQEFGTSVIMTKPSITYRAHLKNGNVFDFYSANDMPDCYHTVKWEEPIVATTIIVSDYSYVQGLVSYCLKCRGIEKESGEISSGRFILKFDIPLVETVTDFYSTVKIISSGYASCDFEDAGFREADLTKVDVLFNGEKVDGLSMIVRSDIVRDVSLQTVNDIAKLMTRDIYKITIQCVVGGKIKARADIHPVSWDLAII